MFTQLIKNAVNLQVAGMRMAIDIVKRPEQFELHMTDEYLELANSVTSNVIYAPNTLRGLASSMLQYQYQLLANTRVSRVQVGEKVTYRYDVVSAAPPIAW